MNRVKCLRFIVVVFLLFLVSCGPSSEKRRKEAYEYHMKGWEARKQGVWLDARNYFRKAKEMDPSFVEAHIDYQEVTALMGKTDSLIQEYRKLLEKNKNKCIYYFLYGRLLGNPADQNREYRRALNINPNCAWAYFGLAYTAYEAQQLEDALGYLKKAIEIDSKKARFHGNLGGVYFYMGMFEDAEKELKLAIELDPNYPPFYYNLFGLYYKKGDYDAAIKALEKYTEIDPYAKFIDEAKTKLKQLRGY